MDPEKVPHHFIDSVSFSVYGLSEIKNLAALEITNPKTFDVLGHPTFGGLHDPAMGPTDFGEVCTTCGLTAMTCPGHLGYVSLCLPVFNPVFFRTLYAILKGSCFDCQQLLCLPYIVQLTLAQLQLLDLGLIGPVKELEEISSNTINMIGDSNTDRRSRNPVEIALIVKETLDDKMKEIKTALDTEGLREDITCVKNVIEARQRLVRNFVKEHFGKGSTKCPHCGSLRRALSVHQNTRFIFGKRRGVKRSIQTTLKAKIQKVRPEDTFEEVIAEEEDDQNPLNITTDEKYSEQTYLTPQDARNHMRLLWKNEGVFLGKLFGVLSSLVGHTESSLESPVDIFFMEAIVVPPSRFRPISMMKGHKYENPQTVNLGKVLQTNYLVKQIILQMKSSGSEGIMDTSTVLSEEDAIRIKALLQKVQGNTPVEKLHNTWNTLQNNVNSVVDSDLDKQIMQADKSAGVKQIIEKKEGLFRKHMMGKRVNYACRSVISPDPYIMVDEIGVPTVFATRLTYPQPVTPWNVRELRNAVINGPNKHPGAVLVQNEDGSIVKLSATKPVQREAVAKQLLTPSLTLDKHGLQGKSKVVYRHLLTGDVLLLNRQPTLHKPGIMAHKARVLPGEKTLRLHYANCKCYNADFDGDEMNAHFPQSELGRSEAYNLASVVYQYLVPKDGTPLSGLIQDHMVSGVKLTLRGRFFEREDYQNLVYGAITFLNRPLKLLSPCIRKPKALWSGKQVLSTIILNVTPDNRPPITLEGNAKINSKSWQAKKSRPWMYGGSPLVGDDMSESQVIIRHGELLCGVLDKAHYGPTQFGLVHCCYEFYGGHMSAVLLTSLARLFTHFLQAHIAFSLGIEDILVTENANKKRSRIMRKARRVGNDAAAEALGVTDPTNLEELQGKVEDAHRSLDDRPLKQMDLAMKSHTDKVNNSISKVCIPDGLIKRFPDNNLQLMVNSGAKGATVNCMQISCLLGQIELEGRRVPLMLSGKTLPSFLAYDTSPRAGGFIDGRFLTGIRPQEFFFHCMAGREGLVDTAVKTSRSGYLQRCLIKHLEGLVVNYDLTVRDSDGSVIQFQYGEDGLDILKSQMIKATQLPLLVKNHDVIVNKKELERLQEALNTNEVHDRKKILRKWHKQQCSGTKVNGRSSGFINFANQHGDILQRFHTGEKNWEECKHELENMWFGLEEHRRKEYDELCSRCPDPLSSCLQSDIHFGAVSEKLEGMVQDFVNKNTGGLLYTKKHSKKKPGKGQISVEDFKDMMYFKAIRGLCEPGEAVGLLAAQSVGEPSTQMTLNTFHFAGRGEMNVTLGIPRMREILMTGSANLATPSMDLPFRDIGPDLERRAEELKVILTNVTLAQVLESVNFTETVVINGKTCYRSIRMEFRFLPHHLFKAKYAVGPQQIMFYMENGFFKRLLYSIKRKMTLLAEASRASTHTSRTRSSAAIEDVGAAKLSEAAQENEGASSDEGEGDGDTTDSRSKQRHDQETEYEEKEEEDVAATQLGNDDMDNLDDDDDEPTVLKDKEDGDEEQDEVDCKLSGNEKRLKKEQRLALKQKRCSAVTESNAWIGSYDYDANKERWCTLTLKLSMESGKLDFCSLIQEEAAKAVIHETPGIRKAFLVKDTRATGREFDKMIKTDGVNVLSIVKYEDIIDLNKISSNDIHAMAQTYGIEAAAKTIVKEVSNVFAAYGIEVDPRHLLLIADYMTFDGTFRGCNRMGMEFNASPFQQMTFETTMHFLTSATLAGYEDNLKSPSSCLVVGHVVQGGTGCHQLFSPQVKVT